MEKRHIIRLCITAVVAALVLGIASIIICVVTEPEGANRYTPEMYRQIEINSAKESAEWIKNIEKETSAKTQ